MSAPVGVLIDHFADGGAGPHGIPAPDHVHESDIALPTGRPAPAEAPREHRRHQVQIEHALHHHLREAHGPGDGTIAVEQVVVAVGPWIARLWSALGLPDTIDVRSPDGDLAHDVPMWTYWYLQEGEIEVDPATFVTRSGEPSPVLHVDSAAPLAAAPNEPSGCRDWKVNSHIPISAS